MGIPEGEEKEKGSIYLKQYSWKLPEPGEANGYPNAWSPKDPKIKYIIIKLSKVEDRKNF